jgi:hypothetical protein
MEESRAEMNFTQYAGTPRAASKGVTPARRTDRKTPGERGH